MRKRFTSDNSLGAYAGICLSFLSCKCKLRQYINIILLSLHPTVSVVSIMDSIPNAICHIQVFFSQLTYLVSSPSDILWFLITCSFDKTAAKQPPKVNTCIIINNKNNNFIGNRLIKSKKATQPGFSSVS